MILDRVAFSNYWNELSPDIRLGDPNSILWTIERTDGMKQSQWFIKVKPLILFGDDITFEYHTWNTTTLLGQVICYSSNDNEEWWGFTHYEDIFIWKLRWEGQ